MGFNYYWIMMSMRFLFFISNQRVNFVVNVSYVADLIKKMMISLMFDICVIAKIVISYLVRDITYSSILLHS